jgi:competence protein ComEA
VGGSVPAPGTGPATSLPATPPATVTVHVAGQVRSPGVYALPAGARVTDAVVAAGGAAAEADVDQLNLAARVADGDRIYVPRTGEAAPSPVAGGGPAAPGSAPKGGTAAGPIDLNTATAEQLDALPGIGPVLAQHILDWRTAHGGFRSVDQLRDVSGIGDATFADLAPLVTV